MDDLGEHRKLVDVVRYCRRVPAFTTSRSHGTGWDDSGGTDSRRSCSTQPKY